MLLCAGDEGVRLIQAVFVRVFKWIESTGSKPVVGGLIILAVAVGASLPMRDHKHSCRSSAPSLLSRTSAIMG